jgi:nitrite reductase/ring-hydroxylating ferredoxin subunit
MEDDMHREISAFIDAQKSWARPLGERVQQWLGPIFARRRPVKDALNGTWLGHPVHPAVTDVPIGAMTVATVLDFAGQGRAADLAIATGLAGMAASAATGAADAVDTYGRPQTLATVHATLMAGSLLAYLVSFVLRMGPRGGRRLARALALAGYGALSAGAYVGGDLTYRAGNQVDRHAFRTYGKKWMALDVTEVAEGQLVKAMLRSEPLVLVREGETIRALHATCSHAGGPLDKGRLLDGCVECPLHQSRFRLRDGHVMQGPAVYDQPAYEVRRTEDGVLEARTAGLEASR